MERLKMWTEGVLVEEQALAQLKNTASLPFIHKYIAVMPDVHLGLGSTIGSVIPTKKAIIPAAVGVDIGCGMCAVKLNMTASELPENLHNVRNEIEKAVPHGRSDGGGVNDIGSWRDVPEEIAKKYTRLCLPTLKSIVEKNPKLSGRFDIAKKGARHLGTLGTGNHFIELCVDESQGVWLMLHSGSRGVGNKIGTYFIDKAKQEMERWYINLPDSDLAYFPEGSRYFKDYIEGVHWAQAYALMNREIMMERVIRAVRKALNRPELAIIEKAINCHHNYVEMENHFKTNVYVTRKGAIRVRGDELGIIPGSMGAQSFIVKGKNNPHSFYSCSHGAGRKMSRTQARKTFTVEDHVKATRGVECRVDAEVVDETPAAYKDIKDVMNAQKDLVEIVHTLKQVVCVKG
jgi:tRNA-splicing ligase RtcB